MPEPTSKVRTTHLREKKVRGERIVMLTAYDASMARILDRAGADVLLVGDSLGMVVMGRPTTLEVTMEAMIHHTSAVSAAVRRALVVADMPFLSYQAGLDQAVLNAGALLQRGGAAAVKLEGGGVVAPAVERITEAGIPVMGHVGLMPQAVHRMGGYRRQATDTRGVEQLMSDARAIEEAGAFALVVECVPEAVAAGLAKALSIPVIGIGAGPGCDGQVLVVNDMLGLTESPPPFAPLYFDAGAAIAEAVRRYASDVRAGRLGASAAGKPADA
jgi:3-methyl-2-oxobutanoate hydroxymethyltransferase